MKTLLNLGLLGVLVFVEVILVTYIFNTIHFSKTDRHYRMKEIIRDTLEVLILLILIYILVSKYLEYMVETPQLASKAGMYVALIVFVFWLYFNVDIIRNVLVSIPKNGGNSNNKENFNENNLPEYVNNNKVFSNYPAQMRSLNKQFNPSFNNVYPFDTDNTISHDLYNDSDKMVSVNETPFEFNKETKVEKLKVVLKNNKNVQDILTSN